MWCCKQLVLFILIGWCFKSSATSILDQDLPEVKALEILSYRDATAAYHRLIPSTKKDALIGAYHYYLGRLHFMNDEADSALVYWQKGFEKLQQAKSTDSLLMHKLIYNGGIVFQNQAAYYQAIQSYKKAKKYSATATDFAKCNIKIGQCFLELGEYTFAGHYLNWAYAYLVKNKSEESFNLQAQALGALGVIYNAQEQPDTALYYIQKRIQLLDQLDETATRKLLMPTLINEANAYITKKQYDKAIASYLVSLKAAIADQNYTYQFRNYINLGMAYLSKKDNTQALKHLQKALSLAISENNSKDIAAATNTLGDVYFQQENYATSTQFYFDALNTLLSHKTQYDLKQIPKVQSVESKDDISYVFEYVKFINKSLVAQALAAQDTTIMAAALQYIHFADSLLFITNQKNVENKSRFYWREQADALYSLAMEAALFTENVNEQFYFIERGKYFVLKNLLSENLAISRLSTEKQAYLNQLKQSISKIEIKHTSTKLNEAQYANLIELKETYHFLMDSLNRSNQTQNLNLKDISLSDLQKQFIKNDATLYISFLESDSATYAIFIHQKGAQVKKINHDAVYRQAIQTFVQTIAQPIETLSAEKQFVSVANQLYEILLPADIAAYPEIIINPSGILNAVAFDALSKNTSKNGLMIYDHTIRYTLSPAIELMPNELSGNRKNNFLYVAPVHFEQIQLQDLPNSAIEVNQLSKKTGGKILFNEKATKRAFQELVKDYQNIHLATHSMANAGVSEFPWIAFSDEKMHLPEIYNLPLRDKFVVLSACETFRGEVMAGEGVMNLVWALHYAGSKSMVATLWNTYDRASNEMMNTFYAELKAGVTKPEALRNAKLKYMAQNGFKPNQWASFIYIGEPNALEISKNKKWIPLVVGGILIISVLSFLWSRKKMKSKD
jgi:CHAT domain-containing protein